MPVDTLVNMVKQEWWDAAGGVALPIDNTVIGEIIRQCRLIEPRRAFAALSDKDRSRYHRAKINEANGLLTLTLTDLSGAQLEYGHGYTYYLYPDPPAVYVNGVLFSPTLPPPDPPAEPPDPPLASYIWRPFSMTLEFTTALPALNPTVQVAGHLIDINEAYARTGEMFLTQISTLVSVKSDEYDELERKVRRRVNHYNRRIIRVAA